MPVEQAHATHMNRCLGESIADCRTFTCGFAAYPWVGDHVIATIASMAKPGGTASATAARLRRAVRRCMKENLHAWNVRVDRNRAKEDKSPDALIITVSLSQTTADVLTDSLIDKAWMTTGEVAEELNVTDSTIRGWLARGGPKDNPFPPPVSYNTRPYYWHPATIRAWQKHRRQIEQQRRSR